MQSLVSVEPHQHISSAQLVSPKPGKMSSTPTTTTQLQPIQTLPPIDNGFFDCWSPWQLVRRVSSKKQKKSSPPPSPRPHYESRFFEHLPGSVPPNLRESEKPRIVRHSSAPTASSPRPTSSRMSRTPTFARVDEEESPESTVAAPAAAPLSDRAANHAANRGSLAAEVAAQKEAVQKLCEIRHGVVHVHPVGVDSVGGESTAASSVSGAFEKPAEVKERTMGRLRRATLSIARKMKSSSDEQAVHVDEESHVA